MAEQRIIFFYDGECGFCNKTVMFLHRKSVYKKLFFCSLQSEFAGQFFKKVNLSKPDYTAAYLWNGKMHKASSAVLSAIRYTKRPYRWLQILLLIPKPLRNLIYYIIAYARKKILSADLKCNVLTELERKQFIS